MNIEDAFSYSSPTSSLMVGQHEQSDDVDMVAASYGLAFWFGSLLISWDPDFDRGSIFTVFFAVMSGSTALGMALPHLTSIAMARGAVHYAMEVSKWNMSTYS